MGCHVCVDRPSSSAREGNQSSPHSSHHCTRARGLDQSYIDGHSHKWHATTRERCSSLLHKLMFLSLSNMTWQQNQRFGRVNLLTCITQALKSFCYLSSPWVPHPGRTNTSEDASEAPDQRELCRSGCIVGQGLCWVLWISWERTL